MSEYSATTLGNVAKIITGPFGSQLHQSDYVDEGHPLIMPQNIGDRKLDFSKMAYISDDDALRLSRYAAKPDDIVYSRRGDVEKHAFITEDGAFCGTGCFLVRFNSEVVEPEYISYYLTLPESKLWLVQHSIGSNMMNLNTDILKAVPIRFPNRNVQKRIVTVLASLDRKISLNNAINSELEKTAKLLYDYWFTQFDFPDADGKPYRSSGGAMEYNAQLKREIPKGWTVKTLRQCVTSINTGLNPRQNFKLGEGNNRYVTIKNIINGRLDLSKCDLLDDDALRKIHERSDVSAGDILFTSIDPVGRLYWVRENPEDWDINESVFSIRPNNTVVSTDYLYAVMDSETFRAKLIPLRTGSVQKGIRIGSLEAVHIAIPSDPVMDSFSARVHPFFEERSKLEKQTNYLTELRDFLLPLLMNGQVTVAMAESAAEQLVIATAEQPQAMNAAAKRAVVFKRLVLAAYILDNICDEPTAGRVKFEKLLYLSEHCAQLPLHSEFQRAAAGPYDAVALYSIEGQLSRNKWFKGTKATGGRTIYSRLAKVDGYRKYVDTNFNIVQKGVIDKLLHLLSHADTERCEIVATLYGAWNDFLIDGVHPSDDQIVDEVLTNWNLSKERIERNRWVAALTWMRQNDIVPVGYGVSTKLTTCKGVEQMATTPETIRRH